MSVIAFLATLAMSASGFVLSKMLMFPYSQVALIADFCRRNVVLRDVHIHCCGVCCEWYCVCREDARFL
jgi:hypothetical protein